MGIEKANLTEERLKYIVMCTKNKKQELKNFLDGACQFIPQTVNEKINTKLTQTQGGKSPTDGKLNCNLLQKH